MKLSAPFIQLPLIFDAGILAAEVAAVDEAEWRAHPQGFPGNSMLPLVAIDGEPADEGFAGRMAPTPVLKRCPYLQEVIASLGVTVGRTRLMRLAGHAEVTKHVDQGYYWVERVRVHVPLVTQPTVVFECGDAAINMAAGECWIFDTWRQHRVLNDAVHERIHLVVDTVGGGRFWGLVAQGRAGRGSEPWSPTLIRPGAVDTASIAYESVNIPAVMSPWEMGAHFGLLFGDTVKHPQLGRVAAMSRHFSKTWLGLWMQYGESPEGREAYRDALEHFLAAVAPVSEGLELTNGLRWYSAMMTVIAKAAVSSISLHDLHSGDLG